MVSVCAHRSLCQVADDLVVFIHLCESHWVSNANAKLLRSTAGETDRGVVVQGYLGRNGITTNFDIAPSDLNLVVTSDA